MQPGISSAALLAFRGMVVEDELVLEASATGRLRVSPPERVTDEHDAFIRSCRDDLFALARVIDPQTQDRCRVFARQNTARPDSVIVPRFHYRDDVPYVRGRCHSCGDDLFRSRWGLCRRCAIAWRVVMNVPIEKTHLDDAAPDVRVGG